ncbi:hypothetical protein [Streptomyces sp. NPDC093149]|uniref:hypothetical protein n=1 Tax=Streptomyces sp. NPDC093149 TaxID=3366031 RepID=UPI00380995A9
MSITGLTGTMSCCRDFTAWDARHVVDVEAESNDAQARAGTRSMATPSKEQLSC